MQEDDDDDLMTEAAKGSDLAFRRLVRRHGPRLRSHLRHLLRSDPIAEELASETLWRAWKKAPGWKRGEAKLTTWLYTVASNLAKDHWRQQARHATETSLPLEAEQDLLDRLEDPLTPEEIFSQKSRVQQVERFMAELPDRQRQALMLAVQEDCSTAEIAAIMTLSPGAVEQLLVRARRTLRDKIRRVQ
ncbi:RNA polymerase sigma factor [Rhodovibrionaceae bacterium A322]